MTYLKQLEADLWAAMNKSYKVHLEPKQNMKFIINDDYTLKVYCYCWLVRKYSIRDKYWECVASSWTDEWIYYEFLSY